MVWSFKGNTWISVNRSTMSLAQRFGTAAVLVAVAGISLAPAAEAHRDHYHHHHSNKKQKAYKKGYKKGYRRAIQNNRRTYYRTYAPVYGPMVSPMPRRVVVAPSPWMLPAHPYHHGNRVNVGFGFNL